MSEFKKIDLFKTFPWLNQEGTRDLKYNDVYTLDDKAYVSFEKRGDSTNAFMLLAGDKNILDEINPVDGVGGWIRDCIDVQDEFEDYVDEYVEASEMDDPRPYWADRGARIADFLGDEDYKEIEKEFFEEWCRNPENASMFTILTLAVDPDNVNMFGKNADGEVCLLDPDRRFYSENWEEENLTEADLPKMQKIVEEVLKKGVKQVYRDTDSEIKEVDFTKGELTAYNDFAIVVSRLCSHGSMMGSVIRPLEDGRFEVTGCRVVKMITRQDFDTDLEYDKAVDEMIKTADGVTGEFVTDDLIAYVEVKEFPDSSYTIDKVTFFGKPLMFPDNGVDGNGRNMD